MPKHNSRPERRQTPNKTSFCSRLFRLILILWLIATLSILVTLIAFTLYIGPSLYREYTHDSPWASIPGIEVIDQILYPDSHRIYELTSYNFKSHLLLSDDQNFMVKDRQHSWIYITGRATCFDDQLDTLNPDVCEKWDDAFDTLAPTYYINPPAHNASLFTLDCDLSPFLCNSWAVTPPALLRLESLGAPHCKFVQDWNLGPHLACPYGVRFVPLPTGNEFMEMLGAYRPVSGALPDEVWQLRTLFESECAHEVYEIQRLLEYVGNGGEVEEFGELLGDLVVGYPIAECFGFLFKWWRGAEDSQVRYDQV